MLTIYICDDEPIWLDKLYNIILSYQFQSELDVETHCFSNPAELLHVLSASSVTRNVYFLDINLNHNLNGFELASQIRTIDQRGAIIFVTAHEECLRHTFTYKIAALDFICKNDTYFTKRIIECLSHIENTLPSIADIPYIFLKSGGTEYKIPLDEIVSIESIKGTHKITVYTANSFLNVSVSMQEIANSLSSNFISCNKGIIINMDHVKAINIKEKAFLMSNEKCFPCSARIFSQLRKKIKERPCCLYPFS